MDIDAQAMIEGIKSAEQYIRDENQGSFAIASQGKRQKLTGPSVTDIVSADPTLVPLPQEHSWGDFTQWVADTAEDID